MLNKISDNCWEKNLTLRYQRKKKRKKERKKERKKGSIGFLSPDVWKREEKEKDEEDIMTRIVKKNKNRW